MPKIMNFRSVSNVEIKTSSCIPEVHKNDSGRVYNQK